MLALETEEKTIIEALLFSSKDPLSIKKIQSIIEDIDAKQIRELIEELNQDYQDRAFQIDEIAGGFLLRTRKEFSPYVSKLQKQKENRLSPSTLEVLAIIAYKQPITKTEIEAVRGVDCTNQIHNLVERELIESKGKMEVPGRPTLWGVTGKFLLHFGLSDLKDLPPLQE
jgi:segregation and condensation protein B